MKNSGVMKIVTMCVVIAAALWFVPNWVIYAALFWFGYRTAMLLYRGGDRPIPALATAYAIISVIVIFLSSTVLDLLHKGFSKGVEAVAGIANWAWLAGFAGTLCGVALLCNCSRAFYNITGLDEGVFQGSEHFYEKLYKSLSKKQKGIEFVFRMCCASLFVILEYALHALHFQEETASSALGERFSWQFLLTVFSFKSISITDIGYCALLLYVSLLIWGIIVLRHEFKKNRNQLLLFALGLINAACIAVLGHSADGGLILALAILIILFSAGIIACIVHLEYTTYNRSSVAAAASIAPQP
jgi:hypothetical protein